MKIIAACGNGMGTSMIIKLKLQEVCKKLKLNVDIEAMSVGQAKPQVNMVDVIICSLHLVDQFDQNGQAKIVGVKNLMDANELEKAMKAFV